MSLDTRTIIRGAVIGLQWLFLTFAVGALVIRSDTAFDSLVTPHFGSVPMFAGAFVAAVLLGVTVDSIKALAPLVLLMAFGAAASLGVMHYAPVVDGVLVRSNALDSYVAQRMMVVAMLLLVVAIPGAGIGGFLGTSLHPASEILPETPDHRETPWWEQRRS